MVKLNKIYTRTGDDGTTGLGTGERRLKSDLRVDAYGTVDEANACIGMARVHTAASHPAIMDTTKAKQDLGWTPCFTALEALRDTLRRRPAGR